MRSPISHHSAHPKLSSIPRQRSEAQAYLEMYQLVVEKQRLEGELQRIEHRREQIYQRLSMLDSRISQCDRHPSSLPKQSPPSPPPKSEKFETLLFEY